MTQQTQFQKGVAWEGSFWSDLLTGAKTWPSRVSSMSWSVEAEAESLVIQLGAC